MPVAQYREFLRDLEKARGKENNEREEGDEVITKKSLNLNLQCCCYLLIIAPEHSAKIMLGDY